MKRLLIALYWLFHDTSASYTYELPKDGFKGKLPLKINHTIVPKGYVNHTMEEDKKYYSQTITTN